MYFSDHKDCAAGENSQIPSFPPNSHMTNLFKLMSAGRLVSLKNLDEIDAYTAYLRQRNLVTDKCPDRKRSELSWFQLMFQNLV